MYYPQHASPSFKKANLFCCNISPVYNGLDTVKITCPVIFLFVASSINYNLIITPPKYSLMWHIIYTIHSTFFVVTVADRGRKYGTHDL